jgi:hypothetical protein
VSACLASVIGVGFFPLRLVSFLASLGCFAILFAFVRKETNSMALGLLSAGLFAATFRVGGAWLDIARVDSLFLLFLLSSLFALRFWHSAKGLISAALLISLSFLSQADRPARRGSHEFILSFLSAKAAETYFSRDMFACHRINLSIPELGERRLVFLLCF